MADIDLFKTNDLLGDILRVLKSIEGTISRMDDSSFVLAKIERQLSSIGGRLYSIDINTNK